MTHLAPTSLSQYRLAEKMKALQLEVAEAEQRLLNRIDAIQRTIDRPAPYVKALLNELADDREVQNDLVKAGVHAAADCLIDKYLVKEPPAFLEQVLGRARKIAGKGIPGLVIDALSGLLKKR